MSQERLNRHQRPITKRIIVHGTLILDTPTCLGSGDADSPTDLALLRDSISNHALLTGSSIAGALRNYLHEYEQGYGKSEIYQELATKLFGHLFRYQDDDPNKPTTQKEKEENQSPLIIDDAISSKLPVVELRDGVKIDGATGTAEEGAKYDLELLEAGTQFPLCFELLVEKEADETELKKALAIALRGLEQGEISLGMKKRRGFGRCHVEKWQVWNFNLEDVSDRILWLNFEHWRTGFIPIFNVHTSITEALGIKLDINGEDKRDRFLLHAEFKLVGSLLIRSGQDSTGRAPDVVHLKSHRPKKDNQEIEDLSEKDKQNLVHILSGTSLAGVLRHRAERIVNTLHEVNQQITQEIVNDVFGFVPKNNQVNQKSEAKASRLVVSETEIKEATELVQNRIAIDRFTGGAYHGALFDEQPIFGGDQTIVTIELELRNPKYYEIGLLLLLLKDLWTQDLPVGGESSIGRGRLQGELATLTWKKYQKNWTITQAKPDQTLQVTGFNKQDLEDYVQAFVKHPQEKVKEDA